MNLCKLEPESFLQIAKERPQEIDVLEDDDDVALSQLFHLPPGTRLTKLIRTDTVGHWPVHTNNTERPKM